MVLHLFDEARGQKPGELVVGRLLPLFVEKAEVLFDRVNFYFDVEAMLDDLAQYAGHVGGLSCM